MISPSEFKPDAFLDNLTRAVADRGKQAALRKYWSPATRYHAYPILGQLGGLTDVRKAVVAALYAEHPQHVEGVTLGRAAFLLGKPQDGEHPYDRHFRRLLACEELGTVADPGELPLQLHRLVRRLAREPVRLDYRELHKNLNFWAQWREDVKLRWAADFWQAPASLTSAAAADA